MANIYTDGSATTYVDDGVKKFRGGYGAIFVMGAEIVHKITGYNTDTTTGAMELSAILDVVRYLKENISTFGRFRILSDSKYSVDGINSWMYKWSKNNWKANNKKTISNVELWVDLYKEITTLGYDVEFKWIKAHQSKLSTDVDAKYNNMVDVLARKASIDGYEEFISEKNN